jgi:hypothetical protein
MRITQKAVFDERSPRFDITKTEFEGIQELTNPHQQI